MIVIEFAMKSAILNKLVTVSREMLVYLVNLFSMLYLSLNLENELLDDSLKRNPLSNLVA